MKPFAARLLLAIILTVTPVVHAYAAWAVATDGWEIRKATASSEAEARDKVMASCKKVETRQTAWGDRGGCRIVGSGDTGCVAVARRGDIMGLGVAEKQSDAVEKAVISCMKQGGSSCGVNVRFCAR